MPYSLVFLVLFFHLDLSSLLSIHLSDYALYGDSSDNRRVLDTFPFQYSNTLVMKSARIQPR